MLSCCQVSIPQRGSPAPVLRAYDVRLAHCAVAAADLLLCCSDGDRAGEMAVSGQCEDRENERGQERGERIEERGERREERGWDVCMHTLFSCVLSTVY